MNKDFISYLKDAKKLLGDKMAPAYKNFPEHIEHISPLLSSLEQSLFVMDLATSQIPYVSENNESITGYSKHETESMGPEKIMELWHEKDFEFITKYVFTEGLAAIKEIKDYDMTKIRISFTYRLLQKQGGYRTLLNQFSHMLEDEERNPLVVMGTTSNISDIYNKPELFCKITYQTPKGKWDKVYERYFSLEDLPNEDFGLTPKEIEVINFVNKGMSSKEIANFTNRSEETIKSQRKSILAKTNCQSMTEVIALANKNKWV